MTFDTTLVLIVFILTYAALAIGRIPLLRISRAGIAIVGASIMLALGAVSMKDMPAVVGWSTVFMLFGMMVISGHLQLSGVFTRVAGSLSTLLNRPKLFLAVLMLVSGMLASVLTNDIVCLIFTPVIIGAVIESRRSPVPYLLGLAAACIIGSAATLIGNPQNIIIGETLGLDFVSYLTWAIVPVVLSLGVAWTVIVLLGGSLCEPLDSTVNIRLPKQRSLNRRESYVGLTVLVLVIIAFLAGLPRPIVAMAAAGFLLLSPRWKTAKILRRVDWPLLCLIISLFIIIAGLRRTGLPSQTLQWLDASGIHMSDPIVLSAITAILSVLINNVPVVVLLLESLRPANVQMGYVLAMASTFAGNTIIIASLANIITVEAARSAGIRITFLRHMRTGVPIAVMSLIIMVGWVQLVPPGATGERASDSPDHVPVLTDEPSRGEHP